MSLLHIDKLSLAIDGRAILKNIDLHVDHGETLGLVGESGSGKSMIALSIMQLLPRGSKSSGAVRFDGVNLLSASEDTLCGLRGKMIGMVFQEPMTALNPLKTIGEQVAEGIRRHARVGRAEAETRARRMLDRVGLPEAQFSLSQFPHQLSGGQRQRVVIAIACAMRPKLLIADEPTTALDVVLQAQILDLLRELVAEERMALLLISHDLAVVADMADRIAILCDCEILATGATVQVLSSRDHPYTRQLVLASTHVPEQRIPAFPNLKKVSPHLAEAGGSDLPSRNRHTTQQFAHPLLQLNGLTRDYPGPRISLLTRSPAFRAVDAVSFTVVSGRSTALVGRSGCGKSTLARMILMLDRPSAGEIRFRGETITGQPEAALRTARRDMQVIFQDPYGSFDPRQTAGILVAEPLNLLDPYPSKSERRDHVAMVLQDVGLNPDDMRRYPHEFSGGQRQRLAIARAIVTRPKLIVADEPVSALDVSIRAQILDLFADLNDRLGVTYLFITHDIHVARAITDDVLVMHDGRIVERGRTNDVLDNPQSNTAKALVAATPNLASTIARRLRDPE